MRDQAEYACALVQMCVAQGRLLCWVLANAEQIILTIFSAPAGRAAPLLQAARVALPAASKQTMR